MTCPVGDLHAAMKAKSTPLTIGIDPGNGKHAMSAVTDASLTTSRTASFPGQG